MGVAGKTGSWEGEGDRLAESGGKSLLWWLPLEQ